MSAWPTAQLGDVAEIQRTSVSPEAIRTGTRYVGLEHISRDGNFNDPPLVSAGELASAKFAFDDSHVLYGKLRPNLGKVARPNSMEYAVPIFFRSAAARDLIATTCIIFFVSQKS